MPLRQLLATSKLKRKICMREPGVVLFFKISQEVHVYKKLRARFLKLYQALFTVKKNKGIQSDLLVKSFTWKCFFVNIFVKKKKIFSQYSIPVKSSSVYLLLKEVLATTNCLNSAYCRNLSCTWYSFFIFKCRLFDRSDVWLAYYKQWSTTGKLFLSYSWNFTGQSTGIWISVWQNITATLLILLLLIRSSTQMCTLLLSLRTYIMELNWFCSKNENISRIKTFGGKTN